MECLDGALKSCFIKEMNMKLSPQICFDHENVVSCDDFFVDEFLDLSNEEEFVEEEEEEEDKASVSGQKIQQINSVSLKHDFSSLPTSVLSVPEDDLQDLEWLSHFVEDSFSQFSTPFPFGISQPESNDKRSPVNGSVKPLEYFKTPVPVKARSKRTRTGGRVWCLRSPSITESSSGSTTSSSSSSGITPAKKPRKRFLEEKARNCGVQPPRRCSHCGVQKTPQWRTGPHGAKTLCNACGVRFKSGRLLPEYRPACSPTFSSELHSNHHRKVLEMRRSKEPAAEFFILGKIREK